MADHIRHVDEKLTTLTNAGIMLQISNCTFFQRQVVYLGHIFKPDKLESDKKNVASLNNAQPPTNKTELRSFSGLCTVYRRFIEDFADLAQQAPEEKNPNHFHVQRKAKKILRNPYLKGLFTALFSSLTCQPSVFAQLRGKRFQNWMRSLPNVSWFRTKTDRFLVSFTPLRWEKPFRFRAVMPRSSLCAENASLITHAR